MKAKLLLILSCLASFWFGTIAQTDTLEICDSTVLKGMTGEPDIDFLEWEGPDGKVITEKDPLGLDINDTFPNVYPLQPSVYTYKYVDQKGGNLIKNGDFEMDMTPAEYSALSDYVYLAPPTKCPAGGGHFSIGTDPYNFNPDPNKGFWEWFKHMPDHTKGDGTGKMLYADGKKEADAVLKYKVNVEDGKRYALIAWVANMNSKLANPPQMIFKVNGDTVGQLVSEIAGKVEHGGSMIDCGYDGWFQFYGFWTADLTGEVEIVYINQNIINQGNDFAMDDIVFAPVFEKEYLVISTPPVAKARDKEYNLTDTILTLTVNDLDDGSYSPCGALDSMTLSQYIFDSGNIGLNNVLLTAWRNGISDVDTAVVEIVAPLSIPEGFSPNKDGINDEFVADDLKYFTGVNVQIFNRWGQVIYRKDNNNTETEIWNGLGNVGMADGKEQPVGTYYYVINAKGIDSKRGSVYLAR